VFGEARGVGKDVSARGFGDHEADDELWQSSSGDRSRMDDYSECGSTSSGKRRSSKRCLISLLSWSVCAPGTL